MLKRKILDILFWVLLIILLTLIIWRVFGNSPTDLSIILTATLTLLLKLWAMSDELKEFKHEVRFSFHKVKEDINQLNKKKR